MDASLLNPIIDKLAEKIGVAASALKPVAVAVVEQTRTLGMIQTLLGCVFALAGLVMVVIVVRTGEKAIATDSDNGGPTCVACIVGAVVFGTLTVAMLSHGITMWVAPLRYLLIK